MAESRTIPVDTIPLPKLAIVMNNFIANTINHLNKLSVKGDEKLAEFDNKLDDLDRMTTLLESKLFSLPEKITSTYPPLEECGLDDLIIVDKPIEITHSQDPSDNLQQGIVSSGTGSTVPPPPPPPLLLAVYLLSQILLQFLLILIRNQKEKMNKKKEEEKNLTLVKEKMKKICLLKMLWKISLNNMKK